MQSHVSWAPRQVGAHGQVGDIHGQTGFPPWTIWRSCLQPCSHPADRAPSGATKHPQSGDLGLSGPWSLPQGPRGASPLCCPLSSGPAAPPCPHLPWPPIYFTAWGDLGLSGPWSLPQGPRGASPLCCPLSSGPAAPPCPHLPWPPIYFTAWCSHRPSKIPDHYSSAFFSP